MIDKIDNDQNIDLKNTYNVINSKKRTKTQLDSNKASLVSYDEVRDNFLPRRQALAMDSFYMDGHTIQHLPLPVINHQAANKQYVDSALSEKVNTTQFENVTRQVLYKANKTELDGYLKKDGSSNMTGNLNMGNKKIINLANPTDNTDAINKAYVDTGFLKLSGGTITGNSNVPNTNLLYNVIVLNYQTTTSIFVEKRNPCVYRRFNMVNHKIINLGDLTNNKDAVNHEAVFRTITY